MAWLQLGQGVPSKVQPFHSALRVQCVVLPLVPITASKNNLHVTTSASRWLHKRAAERKDSEQEGVRKSRTEQMTMTKAEIRGEDGRMCAKLEDLKKKKKNCTGLAPSGQAVMGRRQQPPPNICLNIRVTPGGKLCMASSKLISAKSTIRENEPFITLQNELGFRCQELI